MYRLTNKTEKNGKSMIENATGTKGNYHETNGTSNISLICNEKKPCYEEGIDANTQKHQREAICKRCGVIWHPRNTQARRPTRCPYCQSHRTEWVDAHHEFSENMHYSVNNPRSESWQSNERVKIEINGNEIRIIVGKKACIDGVCRGESNVA